MTTMTLTLKPMLAPEKSEPMERLVDLAEDPAWAFQVKYNGHRVLLQVTDGNLVVIGRDGQYSQHNALLEQRHAAACRDLPDCVLDGELLPATNEVWLFDIVLLDSVWANVTPSDVFSRRADVLAELYGRWSPAPALFRLAPTAVDHTAKVTMAMNCLQSHAEGVMARKLSGVYSPGRRSPVILKVKFVHDADLVVTSTRFEGRDNVVLMAYDENGEPVDVGRAASYGKGHLTSDGEFHPDDVLVIRYNYMSADGRLVGPRIIGRRKDKAPRECTTAQLVYSTEVPVDEH